MDVLSVDAGDVETIMTYTQGRPVWHCLMHTCIMVQLGGNEKHRKYVKTRKFYEIRGEICKGRGK